MKALSRLVILLLVTMCIVCGATLPAWSAEGRTAEGMVIAVQEWTLFIRTASGEPMSFVPYWVLVEKSWTPALPARTVLPALESGERVKVMWTLDEREGGCRRIDSIGILSPREGTTRGMVMSASTSQLVIRPKDEPGTVTFNVQSRQVEGRWVPDPDALRILRTLGKGARVTVQWRWDDEGRKRIVKLMVDVPVARPAETPKPVETPKPGVETPRELQ